MQPTMAIAAARGRGRPRVTELPLSQEQKEMRQIRLRMGVSPEAFARLMGVQVDTVYRWESGRRGVATPILKLARMLLAAQ